MKETTKFDQVYAVEQKLLDPDIRASLDELDVLLDDEFLEIGSSGTVRDKQAIMQSLPKETGVNFVMRNFDAKEIAPNVVLATYSVTRGINGGDPISSLRSSIWRLKDGCWQMAFHPGTPARD